MYKNPIKNITHALGQSARGNRGAFARRGSLGGRRVDTGGLLREVTERTGAKGSPPTAPKRETRLSKLHFDRSTRMPPPQPDDADCVDPSILDSFVRQ